VAYYGKKNFWVWITLPRKRTGPRHLLPKEGGALGPDRRNISRWNNLNFLKRGESKRNRDKHRGGEKKFQSSKKSLGREPGNRAILARSSSEASTPGAATAFW